MLQSLCQDNSIIIVPADRGRATVVVNRTDYNHKAKALLDDNSTYHTKPCDPTKTINKQVTTTLLKLRDVNLLTKQEWDMM